MLKNAIQKERRYVKDVRHFVSDKVNSKCTFDLRRNNESTRKRIQKLYYPPRVTVPAEDRYPKILCLPKAHINDTQR